MQEESSDWGAVEGSGPGARQPHGVVRVHVGQKEQPCGGSPAQAPKVHRDGRVRDLDSVHGGGAGTTNGVFIGKELLREPPPTEGKVRLCVARTGLENLRESQPRRGVSHYKKEGRDHA